MAAKKDKKWIANIDFKDLEIKKIFLKGEEYTNHERIEEIKNLKDERGMPYIVEG